MLKLTTAVIGCLVASVVYHATAGIGDTAIFLSSFGGMDFNQYQGTIGSWDSCKRIYDIFGK